MISFRYHVFTIVAIFLAVALGIAVGNAYVRPLVVRGLEQQTRSLRADLEEFRDRYAELSALVDQLRRSSDVLPVLDGGRLAGARVLILTHEDVDDGLLSETSSALETAGIELVTVLSVTSRTAAAEPEDREELANILGASAAAEPEELSLLAAEVLADRLALGPPRRGAQPGGDDVLDRLLRGVFLRFRDGSPALSAPELGDLGGNGEIVIVLAGGEQEPVPALDAFLLPLVRELSDGGAVVAAGESVGTGYGFVEPLRADEELDGRIVTVDDLDLPVGGAALVLGLERLVTLGQGGDYGVKGSDVTPIPPP